MNYLFKICFLLFAIVAVTKAKEKEYDEEAVRRGDSYIDKMLEDMFENNGEEYDPYVLEDSSVGFHKKVMFVNVSGEAKLHDGHIKGLSTLHRAKHCSLYNEGDKIRVRADLGAGELEFHYKGSVKFMNFGPTVTVTGTLSYIEVLMEFEVNSKTGLDGKLTKFVIDDMRGMKVKVSGLGPLNWAVNPIISGVTKIFKRFVRNFMENKVEKHLREHIPNYQFPVEEGEITENPETISTESEEPQETTPPETLPPDTEIPDETPEPETEAPEETPEPETEAPEETPEPETEAPEETPEPETEAPEETPEPETEAPEETPEPETEAPEETPEPETEAPEGTPEPETEAPEETPEPETEAPEETPETEAPEEILEPETEAPEEILEPETEAPEEILEPETEAPEEILEPETEVPEEIFEPETEGPDEIPEGEENPEPEGNPDVEVNLHEKSDTSFLDNTDLEELD